MTSPSVPARGRPLRVALDATPLLIDRAGVGEFCWRALQALAPRADLEVGAFAVSWRRRHGIAPQLPPGVRVLDRPMPARPLHWAWSRLPGPPTELFLGRQDVVHGTNFVVPPAWRAAMVVTVHDLTPVHFPQLVEQATLAFPGLIRKALRRGAWVHTPSNFVAQEVIEVFGAAPERVRAVHHGLTPRAVTDSARAQAARLLPPWARRYVLAVGTVEPRKDFPTLVEAFSRVGKDRPGLALVIAGAERWGSAQLNEAVAASPIGQRVIRLGRVGDEARDALLAGAAVLAYPSRYEGFGFPPLEAMAAGAPVVTTRCGALEEVLGDAALFIDPGDSEALASAIEQVLDDDRERQRLVRGGHERAALYTWEAAAAGLATLYRDAAGAR
ncbi:MAG TPA: glycosyltransferase family 1 protein [Acidimicrobiales bacterium]|nr:glycosyltransferase family 1 protein [Acidimicrobiales bacterium]